MSLPDNEAMHVPSPSVFAHRLTSLGRTVFRHNRIEAICPEKPVPTSRPFHRFRVAPSPRSSHQAISHNFPSVHPFIASVSLLPLGPLPKLFPTVSFPSTLSLLPYWKPSFVQPSYFHPPYAALPQLFPRLGPTVFQNNRIDGNCPENPRAKSFAF